MLTRKSLNILKSQNIIPGARAVSNGIEFVASFIAKESIYLNVYNKSGKALETIDMMPYHVAGNIYSVIIALDNVDDILYDYTIDGEKIPDPYEESHEIKRQYGEARSEANYEKSAVVGNDYDWENDSYPSIQANELISYSLHVRGFTKHSSSKVTGKGTFKGIIEKISYLKELGINQIELMPAYEFYEYNSDRDQLKEGHPKYAIDKSVDENGNIIDNKEKLTLNYWGFKEAHYFCPKASYSYSDDFVKEFKDMVKALHSNGIEVIMQMFFDKNVNRNLICQVLRFWHINYHVDGFHLMGEDTPKVLVATDDVLSDAKLYFEYISEDEFGAQIKYVNNNVYDINRGFMADARRFLKSDDGSLYNFIVAQRYNPSTIHKVNCITCYEGFTLCDLVSYDYKHNEDNGEDNRDGTNYNYSWNCGVEGPSRKKSVVSLRMRQIKNALCILMLSQAAPMLFMGDELMNTQKGNNNPYCQDNEISWVNWSINKQNREILEFTKELIKLRKNYNALHLKEELRLMDYLSCGYPDISYHQDMAWKSRTDTFMRHIGVLLYGEYFNDDSLYLLYNMHWENHLFGIPKLPDISGWECILATGSEVDIEEINKELSDNPETICVYGRSVIILKSNGAKALGGKKNVRR